MKFFSILILATIVSSCASQKTTEREPAQEPSISSLSGMTAVISIDWKRIWHGISGKTRRDRKESNVNYCHQLYSDVVKQRALLQDLFDKREITEEQRTIYLNMSESMEKNSDKLCMHFVGARKAEKIKNEIMGVSSAD